MKDTVPTASVCKLSVFSFYQMYRQSIVKKHFYFQRMPGSNTDPIYKAEQSKVGRDSTARGTVCFKWQLLIMLSYQPPPTLKGRKTESKTKEQQVYQEGRVKSAFLSSLGA